MKELKFFYRGTKSPFLDWFKTLDVSAYQRVRRCLIRLRLGKFGDTKNLGDGVFEMRLHFGPGYRIYYTERNGQLIILLCAGDKKTQSKDIAKAKQYAEEL